MRTHWANLTGITAVALLIAASVARADYSNDISARDAARRAAVAQARGEVERAQALLTSTTERVHATWKAYPQLQAANKDVEDSRKDFEAARRKVLEKLKTDPQFADAMQADDEARGQVQAEQFRTSSTQPSTTQPAGASEPGPNLAPPSAAQIDAATEKLKAKSHLRDLEAQAIANDPDASKAQSKLNAAQQVAKTWQLQLDSALQNDPEYKSALDQLATARAHVETAAASN